MNLENMEPGQEPAVPFALQYGGPGPSRPALVTVMGVVGIIIASIGVMAALMGTISALSGARMNRTMGAMRWQTPGTIAVSATDAVIGAALAVALLIGSIGLLKLRPWSRQVLLWWAWLYVLSVLVFLMLQISIVVPSHMTMFTNMLATMSSTGPTTMAVTVTSTTMPVSFVNAAPMQMGFMRMGYIIMYAVKAAICLIFPIVLLVSMRSKTMRAAFAAQA